MNDNAKKWVEALRSGEFKQGHGALRKADADGRALDCCLGVGCELYRREVGGHWDGGEDGTSFTFTDAEGDASRSHLPDGVRVWLGLNDRTGRYFDQWGDSDDLANANDSGATFDEIADIILSEPEGLFS